MVRTLALSSLLLIAFVTSVHAGPPQDPPIQVMVLGVYHFDNPGHDLHNAKVDDVTTAQRQAEMAEVAARLGQFKPTSVALEAQGAAPDLHYPKYRAFKPGDLTKNRDERVQLGFRIARSAGLADVYGIDADGEFPYDKVQAFAARTAAGKARLAALDQQIASSVAEFNLLQKDHSVTQLLNRFNEPPRIHEMHTLYNALLAFGDATTQPGAALNAAWYLRNAQIFAKLMQIAKPGDRVLVMFGAGHAYWLRHFVETTPGFQLVEPGRYLLDAKR